jgi:diacylglycerol kinase family enzyme
MKVAAIVNSEAGTVVSGELDAAGLERILRDAGLDPEVHFVPGERVAETAKAALAAGAEVLAAGGGDGTIHTVAAQLVDGKVPLGVLPLGTLNHFARDFGIPTDLAEAARTIATGQVRRLPVGDVNGEIFINNSVLGLYPSMVRLRDREREKGRNKWLATLVAGVKLLPRNPLLKVKIDADGETVIRHTRFLFVGNYEYEMNAFTFNAPDRVPTRDLYVYVARSHTRLGLLGLLLLGLFRDLSRTDHFDCWKMPELTIETREKVLPVYLDGEVLVISTPLCYQTRTRSLPVVLPSSPPPKG